MATAAVSRRIFEEGSLVTFRGLLCSVYERNDSYGYNVYKVRCLDTGELHTAFSYQLDYAEEGPCFTLEFSEEFGFDSNVGSPKANDRDTEIHDTQTAVHFHIETPDQTQESTTSRFREVTEKEKEEFIREQRNSNTVKKNNQHVKLLTEYLNFAGEKKDIKNIEPEELNKYLENFILSVRKRDGENYEPSTLRAILGSIHRFLQQEKYCENIMISTHFSGTRELLTSKFKVTLL